MTALENPKVTSTYGMRTLNGVREHHNGMDEVDAKGNRNVRAIWDSVKCEVLMGYNSGRGNLVRLYYSPTLRWIAQHLDNVNVKTGDKVKQGDVVGLYGSTGYSFGAHLHEEVQVLRGGSWVAVSPSQYAEVPNTAGVHPGNNNRDNQAASTPGEAAPAGNLYALSIGPASKGDMLTFQLEAERLKLPFAAKLKG